MEKQRKKRKEMKRREERKKVSPNVLLLPSLSIPEFRIDSTTLDFWGKQKKKKKKDNYPLPANFSNSDVISIRSIPLANFRALLNPLVHHGPARETYQTNSGVHRSRAECLATKSRIITLRGVRIPAAGTLFSLTRRGNLRIFN